MKRTHAVICFISFLALCLPPAGAAAGGDRIAFINIRMVGGEPVLESVEIVEGKLKIPKKLHLGREKLYCEVIDASGESIFETVVPDPSIQRFEYADEDGRLHSKVVNLEEAYISIRIPYDEAARTLEIYRVEASPDGRSLLKKASRIGSLTIHAGRGGHE